MNICCPFSLCIKVSCRLTATKYLALGKTVSILGRRLKITVIHQILGKRIDHSNKATCRRESSFRWSVELI